MMTPSSPPATSGTEAAFRTAGTLPLPEFSFAGMPAAAALPSIPPPAPAGIPAVSVRKDTAWSQLPAPHFLPDGKPLKLTLSRKLVIATLFPNLESIPISPYECAFTLFLAAHPRSVWEAPVEDPAEPGVLKPLWMIPEVMMEAADEWLDAAFPETSDPFDIRLLAQRLWVTEHTPQVVAASDEKKNPCPSSAVPTPFSTSRPSSPEEIPSSTSTSSTSCPSGTPTPSSTPS